MRFEYRAAALMGPALAIRNAIGQQRTGEPSTYDTCSQWSSADFIIVHCECS